MPNEMELESRGDKGTSIYAQPRDNNKKSKKIKYHKDCAEKPKNGTSYLTRIGDQLLQCLHPLVYFISPFLKHIKFS